MVARNYWTDVFTVTTWEEFLKAGGEVYGHPKGKWNTVQKIKPEDYLLAYLTKISRFVGILEVISDPYYDDKNRIWEDNIYPCRLRVKIVTSLTPETALPVQTLRNRLTFFQNLTHPSALTYPFIVSQYKLDTSDGEAIATAVMEGARNPLPRPIPGPKRTKNPKPTLPPVHPAEPIPEGEEGEKELVKETSAHDEIQWLLLKLGNDMGLEIWVAKNYRNKVVGGHKFTDLERLKDELPVQFFDEATNRTIKLIDVLWLKGNAITAAFEI